MKKITFLIGMILLITIASLVFFYFFKSPGSQAGPLPASRQPEYAVTALPIAGPLARSAAEISGLTWYGDYLILLPQYPSRMADTADGALFALPRQAILDYIDKKSTLPLQPIPIPLFSQGVEDQIPDFEGFEAIVFLGEQVFLTIEASPGNAMMGYVIGGQIAPDLSELRLDPASLLENPPQVASDNHTDESLLRIGDQALTLHEINGAALNPQPHGTLFSRTVQFAGTVPLPPLEYRLTDASALDADGNFWVINYFYPGDASLQPASDPLADRYGQGATHAAHPGVERLVQLHFAPQGITLTAAPPIQLALSEDSRNWEGLALLDKRGFLLATDKYPETILAFVEYQAQSNK